jgi:AcrR family transcriptional regulator
MLSFDLHPMKKPRSAAKPKARATYHHEDLRRALLDAAVAHLRQREITSLTMQVLARAANVSAGAPYHHFDGKVAVLAALAEEGFELWHQQVARAIAKTSEPLGKLEALVVTWLAFAESHPSHYRVMFLPDIEDRTQYPAVHAASQRALELLLHVLDACRPGSKVDTEARAVFLWSTLHGFAVLRHARVLANVPGLSSVKKLEKVLALRATQSALL